jgi:hypothetical protein
MKFIKYIIIILSGIILINACTKDIIATDITKKTINVIAPIDKDSSIIYSTLFWWDAVSGADKYNFQIVKPSFNNIQQLIVDTNIKASQNDVTVKYYFTLKPGTYQWRVNATNNSGSTAYVTRTITIDTTSDISSQTIVLNSPANNSYVNTFSPTFKWGSIFTATKYELYVTKGSTDLFHDTVNSNSKTPLFTSEGVYTWQVKAWNNTSSTDYSTSWAITVDVTPPSSPTLSLPANTTTATVATTSLSLTWQPSTDALSPSVSYSVYIYSGITKPSDTTNISGTNAFLKATPTTTSYSFISATPSQTYWWNVASIDKAGNYSFSRLWTFKTQ